MNDDRISVREYIETLLKERDRLLDVRMCSLDKALQLSRIEDERRFAQLNELRKEVVTDRGQFVLRVVNEQREQDTHRWREESNKRVSDLATRVNTIETKFSTWTATLAALIVVFQLIAHFFLK